MSSNPAEQRLGDKRGVGRPGRPRLALPLAAGLALCTAAAGARQAAAGPPPRHSVATPLPGSSDPYSLYDVEHYSLDLHVHPGTHLIDGTVGIAFRALDVLARLDLDLGATLQADSAWTRQGPAATEALADDRLEVTLPVERQAEERDTLYLRFSGSPPPLAPPFFAVHGSGTLVVQSPGHPSEAHFFWPCKDNPADKASMLVDLTAPGDLRAAASGLSAGPVYRPDGSATNRFLLDVPAAPQGFSFVLSDFRERTESYLSRVSGRTIPIRFYRFPEDSMRADSVWPFLDRPDSGALAVCESLFGPLPFPQEGGSLNLAQMTGCASLPGQGILRQGGCLLDDPAEARWNLVHQTAQQWFGISVTPTRPEDAWLSEGFASYAEALFAEATGGPAAYRARLEQLESPRFSSPVRPPQPPDSGALAAASRKGAWVLHTLRWVLRNETAGGYEALPLLLRQFPQTAPYEAGSATSEDFLRFCEERSGLDLRWFFAPWVYGTGRPRLAYDWSAEAAPEAMRASVHLHLEQLQEEPDYPGGEPFPESPRFFPMFWEVRFYFPAGDSTSVVVRQTSRIQDFLLEAPQAITRLAIDPDHWLLRDLLQIAPSGRLEILRVEPDPSPGPTRITFRAVGSGPVRLTLYDVLGRRIRELAAGPVMPGVHLLTWDGRGTDGAPAQGACFLRLSQDGRLVTRKLIVLRR